MYFINKMWCTFDVCSQLREQNMYKEGDKLPVGGSTDSLTIDRCWKQILEISNYKQRCAEIDEYNRYITCQYHRHLSKTKFLRRITKIII